MHSPGLSDFRLIAVVEKAASIAVQASKRGHDVLYRCALCELGTRTPLTTVTGLRYERYCQFSYAQAWIRHRSLIQVYSYVYNAL